MKRNATLRVAARVVLVSIALGACSGGGKAANRPQTPTSEGGTKDLSSLMAKAATARYKVTYQAGNATIMIAQDPPRYSSIQGNTSVYDTAAGTSVECTGVGVTATCAEIPDAKNLAKQSLAGSFGSVAASLVDALGKSGADFAGITTSNKTIAGRSARCVTLDGTKLASIVGDSLKGTTTICADTQTGVLLESHVDSAKGDDLLATFFGEPSDADFNPPSTPITLPPLDTTPP
jgi:hypothetical protein